jgi:uncharacterized PurR-regulated membrane protein YhhQ (DUF165 family)
MRITLAAAFVGTVIAANWAFETYGIVPVGFGLEGPAGVFFAGLGFVLRDALHETGGRAWVIGAIGVGACLSWWISDGATIPGGHVSIAVASGCAFLVSELADFSVYEPLRERALPLAIGASQVAGAAIDSALFLWLARGSLDFFTGQFVSKAYMVLPFLLALGVYRVASPSSDGGTPDE